MTPEPKPYEIVKNLPRLPGRAEKYHWRKMEIGDSFYFKPEELETVRFAAAKAGIRHKMKFRVSKEEFRVQRTA